MSSKSLVRHRSAACVKQGNRCYYCTTAMWSGSPDLFCRKFRLRRAEALKFQCTAEHLHPKQNGGTNCAANIVAACRTCNLRRHKPRKPANPTDYRTHVRARVAKEKWHCRRAFEARVLTR